MAAAEFGLLAPVLALVLLAMLDVGFAVNERMNLDRLLRSGAQMALTGVEDITALESAVLNSGNSDENDNAPTIDSVDYSLSVTRTCECAGAAGSCTERCGDGTPPSIFFNFAAVQPMETNLLPEFDVKSALRIQVR